MIDDNDTPDKAQVESNDQIEKRAHSWEIADPEEAKKVGMGALHELEAMSIPPADAAHRDFLGAELFSFLRFQFIREKRLSEGDFALWQSIPRRIPEGDQKTFLKHRKGLEIDRDFNAYLMEQFGNCGWRLLMSNAAVERLAQCENDVALIESFGKNFVRRAKLLRRESGGRAKISGEEIRRFEGRLLPELRILWRKIRDDFGKRQSERTNAMLAAFLEKEIKEHPENYQAAHDNLPALLGSISGREPEFASRVRSGAIHAERFLHSWLERATGLGWRELRRLKNQPNRLTN